MCPTISPRATLIPAPRAVPDRVCPGAPEWIWGGWDMERMGGKELSPQQNGQVSPSKARQSLPCPHNHYSFIWGMRIQNHGFNSSCKREGRVNLSLAGDTGHLFPSSILPPNSTLQGLSLCSSPTLPPTLSLHFSVFLHWVPSTCMAHTADAHATCRTHSIIWLPLVQVKYIGLVLLFPCSEKQNRVKFLVKKNILAFD